MLSIKSKYKIAKRLGAGIFEQTQTQKFALSDARYKKKIRRGGRGGADYGRQLLEKQRVRYTYGISEKQLSNYAKEAYKASDPSATLHKSLEMRLDNVAYRAGLASTRRAARQLVSHGHTMINGKRTTIPSYRVRKGDSISIRDGSKSSPLFAHLMGEREEFARTTPQWLAYESGAFKIDVVGEPSYTPAETAVDYPTVFEFYSR